VQSDRIKILRVVQNLLLNALRYTREGGVTVEWQAHGTPERPRWQISIIDSGPGITQTSTAPIAQALEQATREAQRAGSAAQGEPSPHDAAPSADSDAPAQRVRTARASGFPSSNVFVSSSRHLLSWRAATPARPFGCRCRANTSDSIRSRAH
jgi:hypothetical protein